MTGKNVEFKARIVNPAKTLDLIRSICKDKPVEIKQTDTFYHCSGGRIKLRVFADGSGELIYYRRKDTSGPKLSEYIRYPTKNPQALHAALTGAYGVLGVVEKTRLLFITGQTRIHFDQVRYLGDFIEIEVVLDENQSLTDGRKIAAALIRDLNIQSKDLIDKAYIDLLHG